MNVLIFITGLAIGVSAFLYLLSALSAGKKKLLSSKTDQRHVVKQHIQPETIGIRGRKNIPPGSRICPLCGSELTKYEGLYASRIIEKSENKILIMGCKYCYKDD